MNPSIEELTDRYLRGELSKAELAALEQRLSADDAERSQFRRAARLEANLRAHATEQQSEVAAWSAPQPQVEATLAASFRALLWRWWAPFATAVAVLVLGVIFWRDGEKPGADSVATTVSGVSDPYLAIVIDQSADARWAGKDAPRGLGHALGRGRARLESGEATLQLDNGVELQLRGPAELEMLSVDHGVLHRGQLSARVPEGAIGFRVDAPGVNVVDLGTEFSLAVDGSGQPKVHVFKGKVRAALPSMPDSRTELNTGESARFDVALGKVSRGAEDPALFPALEDDALVPHTTGDVRYLRRAPESVKAGTFEHDSIMVFEEQAEFVLPESVQVMRGASKQQEGPEPSVPELVTLPAGTRVKSYYVHFDRVGRGKSDIESKGSITFDRPVLGVLVSYKGLNQTDAWLAHSGTHYETEGGRLVEMRFMGTKAHPQNPNTSGRFDEVHLSPDGRTVTMDLLTGWAVDQFRVLVAVDGK
jgi:ferric-dicitrate binding protein FerR (iron transport regulator)